MAYSYEELEDLAVKAIKKHHIARVTYIMPHIPCSKSTFYDYKLEQSDEIKNALYHERTLRKEKLINKWEKSENATLQIASFKLLADEDELSRLNVTVEAKREESEEIPVPKWGEDGTTNTES